MRNSSEYQNISHSNFPTHSFLYRCSPAITQVTADDTSVTVAARVLQMAWEVVRKVMPRSFLKVGHIMLTVGTIHHKGLKFGD